MKNQKDRIKNAITGQSPNEKLVEMLGNKKGKANKYKAKKTEYNGRDYDSIKEANYAKLLDSKRTAIKDSERVVTVDYQVPYPIIVNGVKVCRYIADFVVVYADERREVVDIKGFRGGQAYAMFRLKKKLVRAVHGVDIIEV